MEQPITAHKAGTVTGLSAEVGAVVTSGAVHLHHRRRGVRAQPRATVLVAADQVRVPRWKNWWQPVG